MKKIVLIVTLMTMMYGTVFGAMSDWTDYEKTVNRMPWNLLKAESDYAVLSAKVVEVQTRWAASTNGMSRDDFNRSLVMRDVALLRLTETLATQSKSTALYVPVVRIGPGLNVEGLYAQAAIASMAFRDVAYANAFIANNVNSHVWPIGVAVQTVEVTDVASAKRAARQALASLIVFSNVIPDAVGTMTKAARRVEMLERRAAGLTVVGPTALPKTAALTEAFNSGTGLVAALNALGLDVANLDTLVAAKIAFAQARKAKIDAGLVDPSAKDIGLLSTWLGAKPIAAWVKSYNAVQ